MGAGVVHRPARVRVGVRAAAGGEQRDRAGMFSLQFGLGDARIIAVKSAFGRGQGRIVAGVAEHGRNQAAGVIIHAQNGDIVIDGAVRRKLHAPVLGEARLGVPERNPRGPQGAERLTDRFHDAVFQLARVVVDIGPLLVVEVVGHREHAPDHRAAVRMRGIEQDLVPAQPVLLFRAFGGIRSHLRRHAEEVGGHQHGAPAGTVFERQGLRVDVLRGAL